MGSHTMTKNKVVLILFPFDDLSSTKVRPAVCLTDPEEDEEAPPVHQLEPGDPGFYSKKG